MDVAYDGVLYAGVPVMINVPGTLTVDNCEVISNHVGILVRGGTATITDTNITIQNAACDLDSWGSGSAVPYGAITMGNSGSSYSYPTDVTIDSVTFNTPDDARDIYMEGASGTNTATLTIVDGSTLTITNSASINENSIINGDIEVLDGATITIEDGTNVDDTTITLKLGGTIVNNTSNSIDVIFNKETITVFAGVSYTAEIDVESEVEDVIEDTLSDVQDLIDDVISGETVSDEDLADNKENIVSSAADIVSNFDPEIVQLSESVMESLIYLDIILEAATTNSGDLVIDTHDVDTSAVPADEAIPSNQNTSAESGLALAVAPDLEANPGETVYAYLAIEQLATDDDTDLAFNITPMKQIGSSDAEVIPNSDILVPVTFKIYLNDSFDGVTVTIKHIADDGTTTIIEDVAVESDDNGKYIQLTLEHFSVIEVTITEYEEVTGGGSTDDSDDDDVDPDADSNDEVLPDTGADNSLAPATFLLVASLISLAVLVISDKKRLFVK